MSFQLDNAKAEEVILYICQKMENAPGFGSVMLAKLLYYIDNVNYLTTGKSMTGFTYIKQRQGPTPKPNQFLPLRDALIEANKLQERIVIRYGMEQRRLVSLKKADVTKLDSVEVALMDEIISEFKNETATAVSELSHQAIGWRFAEMKEEIPYCAYLLSEAEVTEDDVRWGRERIEKHAAVQNH